jgi:predicted Zn-dependent peptidase
MFIVYIISCEKMQLLKKWVDSRYRVKNRLYKLKSGIKLLHTLNPSSQETVINVSIRAGSYYERPLKVPMGTAHFLEHMIGINPNRLHKTKRQLYMFDYGNRKRPHLNLNAATGSMIMQFYGFTNKKGSVRLARKILSIIDYPTKNFPKYIEKERKVIVAERNSYPRTERDEEHQFDIFMVNSLMPGRSTLILGEVEDIMSIKVSDLKRFYTGTFTKENAIISVQSPEDISKDFQDTLDHIGRFFYRNPNPTPRYPVEKVENMYKYKHFYDDQSQGVRVLLAYFIPTPNKRDYKDYIVRLIIQDLLSDVAFRRLREKLGLVYYFNYAEMNENLQKNNIGAFKFACDQKDLKKALDMSYEILYKHAEKFLKTKEGEKWFQDKLSHFLFPMTRPYSRSYATILAETILWGKEVPSHKKAKAAAEKLAVKDILKHLRKVLQKTPPHVWITSSKKDDEIYKVYEKSKFHKHWSSRIPKKLKK